MRFGQILLPNTIYETSLTTSLVTSSLEGFAYTNVDIDERFSVGNETVIHDVFNISNNNLNVAAKVDAPSATIKLNYVKRKIEVAY